MSTRAELEDQAYLALLDVNKHRLEAHTAGVLGDLAKSHSAFDDIITAARAGKAALEAVEIILEERRLGEEAA